jgi:hypothetical protein
MHYEMKGKCTFLYDLRWYCTAENEREMLSRGREANAEKEAAVDAHLEVSDSHADSKKDPRPA